MHLISSVIAFSFIAFPLSRDWIEALLFVPPHFISRRWSLYSLCKLTQICDDSQMPHFPSLPVLSQSLCPQHPVISQAEKFALYDARDIIGT